MTRGRHPRQVLSAQELVLTTVKTMDNPNQLAFQLYPSGQLL